MPSLKFAGLDTDPAYAEAAKHLEERRTERNVLRIERDNIAERLRTQRDNRVADNPERARLEAIAIGKTYKEKEPEEKRLGELNQQIASLDAAIDLLLDRQRRAASLHSIKVCESLKRQHDALTASIFDAVLAAHDTTMAYKDFLDTLNDAGISTNSFPQDIMPAFMENTDKYGRFAQWLNTSAKDGLISRSKIPPRLDFTR